MSSWELAACITESYELCSHLGQVLYKYHLATYKINVALLSYPEGILYSLVDWFLSAYRNRKAVQNALRIYISHHCWLSHAMHNAKYHPLCVSTYDKPFDWLKINSRFNDPMAQVISACPHLSPSDDRLLIPGQMSFSNPYKYMPMAANIFCQSYVSFPRNYITHNLCYCGSVTP